MTLKLRGISNLDQNLDHLVDVRAIMGPGFHLTLAIVDCQMIGGTSILGRLKKFKVTAFE